MNVHYKVELGNEEREVLRELIYGGNWRAGKVKRALILLLADQGDSQEEIARAVDVGTSTVFRTKRDFVEKDSPKRWSTRRARAPSAGCRTKRSCCWWPPLAQIHRRDGRAGLSSYWPMKWCA